MKTSKNILRIMQRVKALKSLIKTTLFRLYLNLYVLNLKTCFLKIVQLYEKFSSWSLCRKVQWDICKKFVKSIMMLLGREKSLLKKA